MAEREQVSEILTCDSEVQLVSLPLLKDGPEAMPEHPIQPFQGDLISLGVADVIDAF